MTCLTHPKDANLRTDSDKTRRLTRWLWCFCISVLLRVMFAPPCPTRVLDDEMESFWDTAKSCPFPPHTSHPTLRAIQSTYVDLKPQHVVPASAEHLRGGVARGSGDAQALARMKETMRVLAGERFDESCDSICGAQASVYLSPFGFVFFLFRLF